MEVEIWSDIACPWCYIGKRRFEAALSRFEHRDEVTVRWRSFELDPSAPAERQASQADHIASKYGMSVDQVHEMSRRMTELAAAEGLDFHFERVRSGNTADGHRLIHLAIDHGRGDEMKERLLRAYHEEGRLVSDPVTLAELAADVGLPAEEVEQLLGSQRHLDDVRADETAAAELGISAVPTFIIDRAIGVSGAQEPEVLLELLRRGWQRQEPAAVSAEADGAACSVDGC
jgi:predicted DsbA family dithiol-disulfide isomerase